MGVPPEPKLYHIAHVDRLANIAVRGLLCDARVEREGIAGTKIGMGRIKERRLTELTLQSHPELFVGDCVPFYFCPRSVMLYVISRANSQDLDYKGGQGSIIHLRADLQAVVAWCNAAGRKWAFTLSNAGSRFFEDRADVESLSEVNWDAVGAVSWRTCRDEKQAEFLVEESFPWDLIEYIGVYDEATYRRVLLSLRGVDHRPPVEIVKSWYY